jgi:RNA polymerase primary sigma factor
MSNEELVNLIQKGTDPASNMEQLYLQNKGLIFAVVKKYRYACQADYNSAPIIEMDELMHEAYFGLIKAVESYDSSQGVLFMSYATSWIRQAVKRFLNNCGSVVRVPVHTQERVYRYNQVTSYYLSKYNRMPTVSEYGKWLGVSEKVIKQLQLFMFRDKVKSLDAAVPGEENDDMTVADTVASDINIENDIVEKVGNEQLHTQLWELVAQVLKDDKKVQILKYRYIDNLTLEEIAIKFKVSKANIDQFIRLSLSRLRTNSKTKRLGAELGFWESKKTVDIDRLRKWAERGYTKFLIEEEIEYAIRMGWLVKGEYY